MVSLPLILIAASFPIFGVDWLARYVETMGVDQPWIDGRRTIWIVGNYYGVSAIGLWLFALLNLTGWAWVIYREKELNLTTFSISLMTMLMISPHTTPNHYVLFFPVLLLLHKKIPRWVLILLILPSYLEIFNHNATLAEFRNFPVWMFLIYPFFIWLIAWLMYFVFHPNEVVRQQS